jgi:hypothetical protein
MPGAGGLMSLFELLLRVAREADEEEYEREAKEFSTSCISAFRRIETIESNDATMTSTKVQPNRTKTSCAVRMSKGTRIPPRLA